jgi:predicted protein tyrosine phosphatase
MIIVSSLRMAHQQLALSGAKKAISILSPESSYPVFDSLAAADHLCLSFHDVAGHAEGLSAPGAHDMQKLLTFLRAWKQDTPLLVHCWAGISRSTAAGYIATCLFQPDADEHELARSLRAASPSATPNPLLVKLADDALGRDGRMVSAIKAIGRGADAFEGTPFALLI